MKSTILILSVAVSTLWFGAAKGAEALTGEPAGDVLATTGSFNGFFYGKRAFDRADAPALRGTISLRVTDVARGKLTAHAELQNGPVNFNGTAWTSTDTNGTRCAILSGKGRVKSTLTLYVREGLIWGALEGPGLDETLTLAGARNNFGNSMSANAAQARATLDTYRGYYTVSLPTAAALSSGKAEAAPQGAGYLTFTVGNGGGVKVAGKLADGTSLSLSSQLILFYSMTNGTNDVNGTNVTETVVVENACVPVFKALNGGKKGWVGGLLWLQSGEPRLVTTERELGWYVRWENEGSHSNGNSSNAKTGADGFEMLLDACGGYYSSEAAVASNYVFTAAEPTGVSYYSGNSVGEYVAAAIPSGVVVTVANGALKMPVGSNPLLVDGAYDYSGANAAMATVVGTTRTGVFKGMFNVYYDYERKGRLAHYKDRVPYEGVLTPARSEVFADLPLGMGFYLVRDTDPSLRSYNLKRSFPVVLDLPQ